jgi:hypothetical protein
MAQSGPPTAAPPARYPYGTAGSSLGGDAKEADEIIDLEEGPLRRADLGAHTADTARGVFIRRADDPSGLDPREMSRSSIRGTWPAGTRIFTSENLEEGSGK